MNRPVDDVLGRDAAVLRVRGALAFTDASRPGAAAIASPPHAHFLWLPRRLLSAWSGVRAWTFPITRFSLSPRNDATTGIGSHRLFGGAEWIRNSRFLLTKN